MSHYGLGAQSIAPLTPWQLTIHRTSITYLAAGEPCLEKIESYATLLQETRRPQRDQWRVVDVPVEVCPVNSRGFTILFRHS